MKHLSGVDNLFLALETPEAPLHVASLSIYDPSTAPGGKVRFKAVLNHFESCLHQWKQFRRKLVELPLGIDRPYWVENRKSTSNTTSATSPCPAPATGAS